MPEPDLPEVHILVCARVADAVAGSAFGHECCQCHQPIAIAPSGQHKFASEPDMALMCIQCAVEIEDGPDIEILVLPGALEEAVTDILERLERDSHSREKKPE